MSDNLSITPTFNLYAEPQTLAGENNSIEPILIGEFTFDLEFLQENYPCVAAENSVPVVNLSTDVSSVNEGENLALNFDLNHPVPAGGLTLELDLIEEVILLLMVLNSYPKQSSNITNLEFIVDDSTGELTGAEVTLAEGATDASIVSEIVADNVTEGDESVSLGLIDGDAYDVGSGQVDFTIVDTSTGDNSSSVPVVNLSTDVSSVNEGENLALNFDLNHPVPAGGLTLELDLIEGVILLLMVLNSYPNKVLILLT